MRPCPRQEVAALSQARSGSARRPRASSSGGVRRPRDGEGLPRRRAAAHDRSLLGDMRRPATRSGPPIAAGKRICVHGDYDVDGICATALAVTVLRRLGADVDWHLPSRFEEGYGIVGRDAGPARRRRVRARPHGGLRDHSGRGDRQARARGLEVVVTDHHRPGETAARLPGRRDAAFGLSVPGALRDRRRLQARAGARRRRARPHLDLVALATVADVVPLVDENRGARRRRTEAARADGEARPARAHGVGAGRSRRRSTRARSAFRLAPRINAAGRLGHPGTALELLLTDDAKEADRLAGELETLNRDRQAVEERILREALAQVEEWPEAKRRRRGYVIAGEDWHRGRHRDRRVAARRALPPSRRAHRGRRGRAGPARAARFRPSTSTARSARAPATSSAGAATAPPRGSRSGRSRSRPSRRPSPRTRRACSPRRTSLPVARVDAVVRGRELTLGLCEELERLAPFGLGNPGVTLLARRLRALRARDASGRGSTCALAVSANGARSGAIAFGRGSRSSTASGSPGRYDVAFKLSANRWNGTVTPQLVVARDLRHAGAVRGAPARAARRVARPGRSAGARGRASLRRARARRGRCRLAAARRVAGVPGRAPRGACRRSRVVGAACLERGPEPATQEAKMGSWRVRCSPRPPSGTASCSISSWRRWRRTTPMSIGTCSSARITSPRRRTSTSSAGAGRTSSSIRSGSRASSPSSAATTPRSPPAILHDVVEDTDATIEQVRAEFGDEVARLVEGVTKLTRIQFQSREQAQAENYRKMIVAMAQDHPRHPHQARGPPAQHADDRVPRQAEAAPEGARDARGVRAARPSPRYPHDQVGARGPRVPDAPPAQVRRDPGDGQRAPRRAGEVRREAPARC